MQNSGFKPHIQGLRAIAVILVVVYHAFPNLLSGGYIGVDVFFVISGYLITGLMFRELSETDKLDFVAFYARRAKRLLPAALLVIAVTILVYGFVLAPLELRMITSAAIASIVYLSNVWFAYLSTDYLAHDATSNPFLHTWSLAVEEQFYLFWPLLIVVLWRFARQPSQKAILGGLLLVGVISLCVSAVLTVKAQAWGFFMLPARAWEFVAGALLLFLPEASSWNMWTRRIATVLGFTLVALSAVSFDQYTTFPGWMASVPVIGTCLLIQFGGVENSIANRLLGSKPAQFFGNVSYSWYLWHWPVLILVNILWPQATVVIVLAGVVVSVLLAWLSYVTVENTFRKKQFGTSSRSLLIFGVASAVLVLAIYIVRIDSIADSQHPTQIAFLNAVEDTHDLAELGCFGSYADTEPAGENCVFGAERADKTIVLLGDSHAAHWFPGLELLAKKHGWRLMPHLKSACPALDIVPFDDNLGRLYEECAVWMEAVAKEINTINPDLLLVGNSTEYYRGKSREVNFQGLSWEQTLASLLSSLEFKKAAIIGDVPRPTMNVPYCLARAGHFGRSLDVCSFALKGATVSDATSAERKLAETANFGYLDVTDSICSDGICAVVSDDLIYYSDNNHITASFSKSIVAEFEQELIELLR